MDQTNDSCDVIVVGARAAGAATAMLLARHGLRVIATERASYGSDTLSTHALSRGAVHLLDAWGVLDDIRSASTPALHRTTFHYGDEELVIPVKARGGVDGLYAPRRTVLDPLLADAAREAGAEVRYGVTLRDLIWERGRVIGAIVQEHGELRELRARLVVGADGIKSTVARLASARVTRRADGETAYIYGYFSGLESDGGIHFYYVPGATAGLLPTNAGTTCVFVGLRPDRFRLGMSAGVKQLFADVLQEVAPNLGERVAKAQRTLAFRTFGGAPGYMREAWGPGTALVGDAGYFKDPATAHGITDAFRDAVLLSRAICRGTESALTEYEAERDELSTGIFSISSRIGSLEWSMEELRALHVAFADESKREYQAIAGFETPSPRRHVQASNWVAAQMRATGIPAVR